MTHAEMKIELLVEEKLNVLDARLLKGVITEKDYDKEIKRIDKWAEREYRKISKVKETVQ